MLKYSHELDECCLAFIIRFWANLKNMLELYKFYDLINLIYTYFIICIGALFTFYVSPITHSC